MKIPRWLAKIRKWFRPQNNRSAAALDARVVDAVESLAALLEVSAAEEKTQDEAVDAWERSEEIRLLKRYSPALAIHLPWWNYVRNPVWLIAFTVHRQRLIRARSHDVGSLQHLDYLLGRAEFMLPLSWYAKQSLREQIASGALSRWRAFSLVLSGAFSMTSAGDVHPRGVGKWELGLGTILVLQMVLAFVALAVVAAVALAKPCAQDCLGIGALHLMMVSAVLGFNAWSFSWGRQQKARQLTQIFGHSES